MLKRMFGVMSVALFLIASCTINEPDPPVWDTTWKFDLPVKNVTLKEIVNDSTLIADTTNGQPIVRFNIEDSTDWEYVKESDLTVTPENTSFEARIGTIKLQQKSEVKSTEISLSELLPPELLTRDTIPRYPGRTVTPDPKEVTYDFFERAVIKNGKIYLTFHNDLFLKVDSGMTIDVFNNDSPNPTLITSIVFSDPIEPYAVTQSEVVDLSGLEISNHFLLKYTIPIAGSDTMQVVTDEQKNGTIYSILTIEDIEVSEADAKIPEQTFNRNQSFAMPQSEHKVIEAAIKSGHLTLNLQNQLPLYAQTKITLPEILENGNAKQIVLDMQPNENKLKEIDLSGLQIKNSSQPGQPIDSIHIQVEATVHSNDQIVTISETDQIAVDVIFTDIIFQKITGILQPVSVDIEPNEVDNSDLFEKIQGNGLVLDDLQLKFKIENQIDIPLHLILNLKAQNGSQQKSMVVDEWIKASSEAPFTEIILDRNYKTPNSIIDLFSILPEKIAISGQATIEGQGTVELGQGVRALYSVDSPLFFKLENPIEYESETDSIKKDDIDQDVRDRLADDWHQGEFHLILRNGTPFATNFSFILADDSTQVNSTTITDSTKKIVINANIERGQIGADGYVESPTENEVVIKLGEQQMQLFQKSPIYFKQKATILPTGDTKVKVRTSDMIEVDGYIQTNFTVRFE